MFAAHLALSMYFLLQVAENPRALEVSFEESKLIVEVNASVPAKQWRESLARYFEQTPKLSDEVAIEQQELKTGEGDEVELSQRVRLEDVLPEWMVKYSGKNSPAPTNCATTSFFLSKFFHMPFGFHTPDAWAYYRGLPFVKEWIEQGNLQLIEQKDFHNLQIGDVISISASKPPLVDGIHMYTYLGYLLVFESNPADRKGEYLFSVLDSDYLPLHKDEEGFARKPYLILDKGAVQGLRTLRPLDAEKIEEYARENLNQIYTPYRKAKDSLASLWKTGKPLQAPDAVEKEELLTAFRECRQRWKTVVSASVVRQSPRDEFFAFCDSTLEAYLLGLELL